MDFGRASATFKYNLNTSTNAVMGHLKALERKGAINSGQARTFKINHPDQANTHFDEPEIPENATEVVDIPVYGAMAAGWTVESSGAVGKIQVDIQNAGFSSRKQSFAHEVRGDSMVDAEIYDGDRVIIEPREAHDGDIVAALIDGEVTLKRLIQKAGDPPYLKAENKNYRTAPSKRS